MIVDKLKAKKVAVWGMGAEGISAVKYLRSIGVEPGIITLQNEQDLFNYELIVKSPGISIYKPIIKEAVAKGVEFTSGTNIFLEAVREMPRRPILVAVTGTKGKSTVAAMIAHILKVLNCQVFLGGNFGTPLLDALPNIGIYRYIVAEISSYQATDLRYGFDIALLNNLYPEHVDWHGSHQQYFVDKLNVIYLSRQKILNGSDAKTIEFFGDKDTPGALYFNCLGQVYPAGGQMWDGSKALFKTNILTLLGNHNVLNLAAALTVVKVLGFSLTAPEIVTAVKSFEALPHRLERIKYDSNTGVSFIDDSISTTPETALAALKVYGDQAITLIAGGFERQQDYAELCKYIVDNKVKVVALPTTGERIYEEVRKNGGMAARALNMKEAVQTAKTLTPQGGVVLLSPAAPSYGMYNNFAERGADFAKYA